MPQTEVKLRAVGTTKLEWTPKKLVLGKEDLKDFEILFNRRDIRKGQVTKLYRLLCEGNHFQSNMVVNRKNNKYRLIDGNHRYEALKRFFEKYPDRRVEVVVSQYTNLEPQEEKAVYSTWNKGTKQSTNDYIKAYWNDIKITKKLKTPYFPCNVSHVWGKHTMELKLLINPYLVKDNEGDNSIAFQGSAHDFVEKAMELNGGDVQVLKQFLEEYSEVFGVVDKESMYYKLPIFTVIMRLWLKNYSRMNPEVLKKRLKKLIGHERVIYWTGQGGARTNLKQCIMDFRMVLNKGRTNVDNMVV